MYCFKCKTILILLRKLSVSSCLQLIYGIKIIYFIYLCGYDPRGHWHWIDILSNFFHIPLYLGVVWFVEFVFIFIYEWVFSFILPVMALKDGITLVLLQGLYCCWSPFCRLYHTAYKTKVFYLESMSCLCRFSYTLLKNDCAYFVRISFISIFYMQLLIILCFVFTSTWNSRKMFPWHTYAYLAKCLDFIYLVNDFF